MLTVEQIIKKIDYEIVVDAYDDDEVGMGWYETFAGQLEFPFTAMAKFKKRDGSIELKKITITGLSDNDSDFNSADFHFNMRDGIYIKTIAYSKLSDIEASEQTLELFQCWDYWVEGN